MSLKSYLSEKHEFFFLDVDEYKRVVPDNEMKVLEELSSILTPMSFMKDDGSALLYASKMTSRPCKVKRVTIGGGSCRIESVDSDTRQSIMTTQSTVYGAFKTISKALSGTLVVYKMSSDASDAAANRTKLLKNSVRKCDSNEMYTVFEILVSTGCSGDDVLKLLKHYETNLTLATYIYIKCEDRYSILLQVCFAFPPNVDPNNIQFAVDPSP